MNASKYRPDTERVAIDPSVIRVCLFGILTAKGCSQDVAEEVAEHSSLSGEAIEPGPLEQLLGHSITYRIAVGAHPGVAARKDERKKERNWSACAATSQDPRCRKSGCRC
jgi:hypothetical protein